jgi:benzil reductase ((S)-benzoin forming)
MSLIAVITGTSSGLGKAVHEALTARGTRCIAIARRPAADALPPQITADLAQAHDWSAKLAPFLSQLTFERLALFDIAAVLPQGAMRERGFDAKLEEAMQVNVHSPLAIGRALADMAADAGAPLDVVHISSGAANRPIPNWSAYCASKAAAAMAWRALDAENAHVTAHIVQPGVIDTPMQAALRANGDPTAAPQDLLRAPQDVAADILSQCGFVQ